MVVSVSFLELRLTVDASVVIAEESVDKLAVVSSDTFEAMLLNLSELSNHFFINLEILSSVLPRVAERLAAHAAEGKEARHTERGIDKDTQVAAELFGIHGAHGGGHDKVGL